MVNSCCVKDCYNIQKPGRENDRRYFQVPAVVCGKGEETFQLTSRRRREWLAQLKLKGLTFESTSRRFVCSDHFVSGVPAYLRDVNAPNWKPTLKLGHSDSVTPNSDRYERLRGRQSAGNDYSTSQFGESEEVLMQHDGGAEGFCNAGCMNTPPPQFGEDGGTYCQTDNTYANSSSLSAEEERMMRDELNRLTVENLELKEKLAQKEMTLESLKDSDDTVRYFTGLTNYLTLAALFRFVVNDIPRHKRRALSPFQALMLTLLHLRLDMPLQHLAYIFSVSRSTASKVFHETLNVLFYKLKPMVFWPSRESIRKTLPPQFQEYPWRKTVSIIDCFELFIERPSSPDASAQTWSNYKSNNTIKYLISITPQGLISFISKGWGGRVSDKQITGESGYLTNLLPGDLVLADRGFDIPELAAMVGAEVKIPAFTRGKCQMTAHEIESTRKLAHVRIHVERVIGLLCGKYTILNGDLPVELLFVREGEELTTLDKIVTVCCSLVNLCDGIIL